VQEQEVAVVAQALDELQHAVEAVTARSTENLHATDTTTIGTATAAATAVAPSTALLTAAAFVNDGMSVHHCML
jgi:hypothetical protein